MRSKCSRTVVRSALFAVIKSRLFIRVEYRIVWIVYICSQKMVLNPPSCPSGKGILLFVWIRVCRVSSPKSPPFLAQVDILPSLKGWDSGIDPVGSCFTDTARGIGLVFATKVPTWELLRLRTNPCSPGLMLSPQALLPACPAVDTLNVSSWYRVFCVNTTFS
jgi:hypothetical protein